MSDIGKLIRGEKWTKIRAGHKAWGTPDHMKQVKWLDDQPNIVADIKFYKDSIKPAPEVKAKGKVR